jgi:hypothetical protein
VRVFFYLEDRERTLDSPTDKIMLSLATVADELEREKASKSGGAGTRSRTGSRWIDCSRECSSCQPKWRPQRDSRRVGCPWRA